MFFDQSATAARSIITCEDSNEIVTHYKKFIYKRTWNFLRAQQPGKFSFKELYQVACLGAVLASKRFRPELGFDFSTYARQDIDGELVRYAGTRDENHQKYDDQADPPSGRVGSARFTGLKWQWERDGHLHEKITVAPALKNIRWKRDPDACLRNGWACMPPHDKGDLPQFDKKARAEAQRVKSRRIPILTPKEIDGWEVAEWAPSLETDIGEAKRHAAKRGVPVEPVAFHSVPETDNGVPQVSALSVRVLYIMAEPTGEAEAFMERQVDKEKPRHKLTWGGKLKEGARSAGP